MKKQKKVTETSIYSGLVNLNRIMIKNFNNSPRLISVIYGEGVIGKIRDMFLTLRKTFDSSNPQEKLKYAELMIEQIKDIEYLTEICLQISLNFKKSECMKLFGELTHQINSWIGIIKSRM